MHKVKKFPMSLLQRLKRFGLYGPRKYISTVFRDLHEELKKLSDITWFMYATSGPRPLRTLGLHNSFQSEEQILTNTMDTLNKWTNLSGLYIKRVALSGQVARLFGALSHPLKTVILYANWLLVDDLEYLTTYRGLSSIEELSLERTDLSDMGKYVAEMAKNLYQLKVLNLKETNLGAEEVVDIVSSLQSCPFLETLIILDSEKMWPPIAYEVIIDLACRISSLDTFYIFPFNHPSFEMQRREIEDKCNKILKKRKKDIRLMY